MGVVDGDCNRLAMRSLPSFIVQLSPSRSDYDGLGGLRPSKSTAYVNGAEILGHWGGVMVCHRPDG